MTRLLRSLTLAVLLLGGLWAGATAADLFDPPTARGVGHSLRHRVKPQAPKWTPEADIPAL